MPSAPSGRWLSFLLLVGVIASLYAIPAWLENKYLFSILVLVLFRVLLVSSLRVNHLMGYVSLGHVGFMLVGAYTSALLVTRLGWPIGAGLLGSMLVPFGLALLLGYPFLRVKGLYFVILTFLMAETLRLAAAYAGSLTGGATGLSPIPPLDAVSLGPVAFSLDTTENYYLFLLSVVLLVGALLYALERSQLGFYWKAIAQSEGLCASAGVNTTWLKTLNLSIGAAVAGFAGALWAHYETVLTPGFTSVFGAMSSILLLAYLYVGGKEYFFGPVFGVAVLTVVAEAARLDEAYVPMVTGVAMIGVVFILPDGVTGGLDRARAFLGKTRAASTP